MPKVCGKTGDGSFTYANKPRQFLSPVSGQVIEAVAMGILIREFGRGMAELIRDSRDRWWDAAIANAREGILDYQYGQDAEDSAKALGRAS